MKLPQNIQAIYFIGIGGIGMSALARYFKRQGIAVSGYDKTVTELTQKLEAEGISIYYTERSIANLPQVDLVVYTPAIPQHHSELQYYIANKCKVLKRAEVLAAIANTNKAIAIAGTHGKTTLSSMLSFLLNADAIDAPKATAFVGGIMLQNQSNFVYNSTSEWTIVEADEYDRSFLHLQPIYAAITATDADHLNIYKDAGSMQQAYIEFANQVKDTIWLKKGVEIEAEIKHTVKARVFTYHRSDTTADYYANNVKVKNAIYHFDLHTPTGIIKNLALALPGMHNVENAIAALAIAQYMGMSNTSLQEIMPKFKGVKRRFEYRIKTQNQIFIDDYAHHPEEIKQLLSTVKTLFPDKEIYACFQPHLYTRTQEHANEFAESLSMANKVMLLPIYPARELPIAGVSSQLIYDALNMPNTAKHLCSKKELLDKINIDKPKCLVTIGAGNIDKLVPKLEELLLNI